MADPKLTAPVGLSPRVSDGKPVKNKPADVVLIRRMLGANGIGPLGTSGKMDTGLTKAIAVFQKKIGINYPDKVIDPGGRTAKAMKSKYAALLKKEASVVMVKVTYQGTTVIVPEADAAALEKRILVAIKNISDKLAERDRKMAAIYDNIWDSVMLRNGFMAALGTGMLLDGMSGGWLTLLDSSKLKRSRGAVDKLNKLVNAKDIAAMQKQVPITDAAVLDFCNYTQQYLKEIGQSHSKVSSIIDRSKFVAYGVLGISAAPALVALGASAGAAAVVGGGGVAVFKTGMTQMEAWGAGKDKDVTYSAAIGGMIVEGTKGAALGFITSKIPPTFGDDMGSRLAKKFGLMVPAVSGKELQGLMSSYLAGAGAGLVTSAMAEAIGMLSKGVKTGKVPISKDVSDTVFKILSASIMGGMMKNLGGFHKQWVTNSKDVLKKSVLPDVLISLVNGGTKLTDEQKNEILTGTLTKVNEQAFNTGIAMVVKKAKGSESEKALMDMALKALKSDKVLKKMIQTEMRKMLKKNNIPLK